MTKMTKARQSLQISHSRDSYASCTFVFVLEIWLKIKVEDVSCCCLNDVVLRQNVRQFETLYTLK